MQISKVLSRTGRMAAASMLAITVAATSIGPASAQGYGQSTGDGLGSVLNCDAAGTKQRDGAILGGLLGAAAGAAVAKRDGQGAVIGGLLGAAAGSYMGCQKQRQKAAEVDQYDRGYASDDGRDYDYAPQGYDGEAPLARGVRPAAYIATQEQLVATGAVNLRAGPSTSFAKIGQLYAGQRFEALGVVRGTDWVLVGENGVGIGYVNQAYVRPARSGGYAGGYGR
jgi:hypothetical protein